MRSFTAPAYLQDRRGQASARPRGLLFDKDGTLFDFQATWGRWCAGLVRRLADGDGATAERLAAAMLFDLEACRFHKASPIIAGTVDATVAAIRETLPRMDERALRRHLIASAAEVRLVPAADLPPLLRRLDAAGLALGIATNDAEASTRAHLASAGVLERFVFIAGFDSGFGAKPGTGMLAAFCRATGLAPGEVAMVGDSTHDLEAARAAGMIPIAVLTGPAEHDDLAPHADAVLADIGALPGWLGLPGAPDD